MLKLTVNRVIKPVNKNGTTIFKKFSYVSQLLKH